MYAEVKRDNGWHLAEPLERNSMADAVETGEEPEWIPVELGGITNSALFAILANIGRYSNGPFRYIDECRGLPRDVSSELKTYFDSFGEEAEFPSWLLAKELNDFDWDRLTDTRSAMVETQAAHLFRHDPSGRPRVGFPYGEWPEGLMISYSEWKRDGVRVEWIETHREAVGTDTLDELLIKLRSYGRPDNVRVVFWFTC